LANDEVLAYQLKFCMADWTVFSLNTAISVGYCIEKSGRAADVKNNMKLNQVKLLYKIIGSVFSVARSFDTK
jgi:hypothetical protein